MSYMLPELAMARKAQATVEKHGQWRKSVRHCLEPSTDNKEGVGKSVRHCLEPSTDSKEGVGCFSMSRHSLEPSIDSQEGVERF